MLTVSSPIISGNASNELPGDFETFIQDVEAELAADHVDASLRQELEDARRALARAAGDSYYAISISQTKKLMDTTHARDFTTGYMAVLMVTQSLCAAAEGETPMHAAVEAIKQLPPRSPVAALAA